MSKAMFRPRPDQVMESDDLSGISTRSRLTHRYSLAHPAVESIVPTDKLCRGYYDEEARLLYLQDAHLKVYSLDGREFKRIYTVREVERFAVNRSQPTRFIVHKKSKLRMEMHDVYEHVIDSALLFGPVASEENLRLWFFFSKSVIASDGKTLYCLINPGEKTISSRLVEAALPFTISYVSMGETYLVVCFEESKESRLIYVLCNKSLKVLLKYEISSTRVITATPLAFVPSLSLFMFVANTNLLGSVTLPLNFHQKKGSSKPALLKTPPLMPTLYAMAHVDDRTKIDVSLVRGGSVGLCSFIDEQSFTFVDAVNRCVKTVYTFPSHETFLLLQCPPEGNSRHYFIVGSHLCYISSPARVSEQLGLHKVSSAALEKKFMKALKKNDLVECFDIAACRAEALFTEVKLINTPGWTMRVSPKVTAFINSVTSISKVIIDWRQSLPKYCKTPVEYAASLTAQLADATSPTNIGLCDHGSGNGATPLTDERKEAMVQMWKANVHFICNVQWFLSSFLICAPQSLVNYILEMQKRIDATCRYIYRSFGITQNTAEDSEENGDQDKTAFMEGLYKLECVAAPSRVSVQMLQHWYPFQMRTQVQGLAAFATCLYSNMTKENVDEVVAKIVELFPEYLAAAAEVMATHTRLGVVFLMREALKNWGQLDAALDEVYQLVIKSMLSIEFHPTEDERNWKGNLIKIWHIKSDVQYRLNYCLKDMQKFSDVTKSLLLNHMQLHVYSDGRFMTIKEEYTRLSLWEAVIYYGHLRVLDDWIDNRPSRKTLDKEVQNLAWEIHRRFQTFYGLHNFRADSISVQGEIDYVLLISNCENGKLVDTAQPPFLNRYRQNRKGDLVLSSSGDSCSSGGSDEDSNPNSSKSGATTDGISDTTDDISDTTDDINDKTDKRKVVSRVDKEDKGPLRRASQDSNVDKDTSSGSFEMENFFETFNINDFTITRSMVDLADQCPQRTRFLVRFKFAEKGIYTTNLLKNPGQLFLMMLAAEDLDSVEPDDSQDSLRIKNKEFHNLMKDFLGVSKLVLPLNAISGVDSTALGELGKSEELMTWYDLNAFFSSASDSEKNGIVKDIMERILQEIGGAVYGDSRDMSTFYCKFVTTFLSDQPEYESELKRLVEMYDHLLPSLKDKGYLYNTSVLEERPDFTNLDFADWRSSSRWSDWSLSSIDDEWYPELFGLFYPFDFIEHVIKNAMKHVLAMAYAALCIRQASSSTLSLKKIEQTLFKFALRSWPNRNVCGSCVVLLLLLGIDCRKLTSTLALAYACADMSSRYKPFSKSTNNKMLYLIIRAVRAVASDFSYSSDLLELFIMLVDTFTRRYRSTSEVYPSDKNKNDVSEYDLRKKLVNGTIELEETFLFSSIRYSKLRFTIKMLRLCENFITSCNLQGPNPLYVRLIHSQFNRFTVSVAALIAPPTVDSIFCLGLPIVPAMFRRFLSDIKDDGVKEISNLLMIRDIASAYLSDKKALPSILKRAYYSKNIMVILDLFEEYQRCSNGTSSAVALRFLHAYKVENASDLPDLGDDIWNFKNTRHLFYQCINDYIQQKMFAKLQFALIALLDQHWISSVVTAMEQLCLNVPVDEVFCLLKKINVGSSIIANERILTDSTELFKLCDVIVSSTLSVLDNRNLKEKVVDRWVKYVSKPPFNMNCMGWAAIKMLLGNAQITSINYSEIIQHSYDDSLFYKFDELLVLLILKGLAAYAADFESSPLCEDAKELAKVVKSAADKCQLTQDEALAYWATFDTLLKSFPIKYSELAAMGTYTNLEPGYSVSRFIFMSYYHSWSWDVDESVTVTYEYEQWNMFLTYVKEDTRECLMVKPPGGGAPHWPWEYVNKRLSYTLNGILKGMLKNFDVSWFDKTYPDVIHTQVEASLKEDVKKSRAQAVITLLVVSGEWTTALRLASYHRLYNKDLHRVLRLLRALEWDRTRLEEAYTARIAVKRNIEWKRARDIDSHTLRDLVVTHYSDVTYGRTRARWTLQVYKCAQLIQVPIEKLYNTDTIELSQLLSHLSERVTASGDQVHVLFSQLIACLPVSDVSVTIFFMNLFKEDLDLAERNKTLTSPVNDKCYKHLLYNQSSLNAILTATVEVSVMLSQYQQSADQSSNWMMMSLALRLYDNYMVDSSKDSCYRAMHLVAGLIKPFADDVKSLVEIACVMQFLWVLDRYWATLITPQGLRLICCCIDASIRHQNEDVAGNCILYLEEYHPKKKWAIDQMNKFRLRNQAMRQPGTLTLSSVYAVVYNWHDPPIRSTGEHQGDTPTLSAAEETDDDGDDEVFMEAMDNEAPEERDDNELNYVVEQEVQNEENSAIEQNTVADQDILNEKIVNNDIVEEESMNNRKVKREIGDNRTLEKEIVNNGTVKE